MLKLVIFSLFAIVYSQEVILDQYPNEDFVVFDNQDIKISIKTTGQVDSVLWWINHVTIHNTYSRITHTTSQYNNHTLIIEPSIWEDQDRINVQCAAIIDDTYYYYSKDVSVRVQRVPERPTFLKKRVVTYTWGAPDTLDVLNADPDLWYSYIRVDGTDGRIVCCQANYTKTTAKCLDPEWNSVARYYFAVVAINGAGIGGMKYLLSGYTDRYAYQINKLLAATPEQIVEYTYYPNLTNINDLPEPTVVTTAEPTDNRGDVVLILGILFFSVAIFITLSLATYLMYKLHCKKEINPNVESPMEKSGKYIQFYNK